MPKPELGVLDQEHLRARYAVAPLGPEHRAVSEEMAGREDCYRLGQAGVPGKPIVTRAQVREALAGEVEMVRNMNVPVQFQALALDVVNHCANRLLGLPHDAPSPLADDPNPSPESG